MQGLEVISSLHSLPGSSTSHYKPHGNNTINGTPPNLELELTQSAPVSSKTGDGGDNNTSNQPNGGAGMDVDTGSPSTEAVKGIKRVRETPQWPSESAILVAGESCKASDMSCRFIDTQNCPRN